jgi:hypothetical protein
VFEPESILIIIYSDLKSIEKRSDESQVTHIYGWCLASKPRSPRPTAYTTAGVEEMSRLEELAGLLGEHSYIYIIYGGPELINLSIFSALG